MLHWVKFRIRSEMSLVNIKKRRVADFACAVSSEDTDYWIEAIPEETNEEDSNDEF